MMVERISGVLVVSAVGDYTGSEDFSNLMVNQMAFREFDLDVKGYEAMVNVKGAFLFYDPLKKLLALSTHGERNIEYGYNSSLSIGAQSREDITNFGSPFSDSTGIEFSDSPSRLVTAVEKIFPELYRHALDEGEDFIDRFCRGYVK